MSIASGSSVWAASSVKAWRFGFELSVCVSAFVPFGTTEGFREAALGRFVVEEDPRRGEVSFGFCENTQLGSLNVSFHASGVNFAE
jgi:hypothetical protein